MSAAVERRTAKRAKRKSTPRKSTLVSMRSRGRNDRHHITYEDAINHATRIIHQVCCLAGDADLIDQVRRDLMASGVTQAILRGKTPPVFDWLMASLSYQGISDRVATDYMARHGYVQWHNVARNIAAEPTCPKLELYWHFFDCRFDKISRTCAEPCHIIRCPLPSHRLRNGRLNQTAYALYLFVRDLAEGDLIGWIQRRLVEVDDGDDGAGRQLRLQAALIEPLRGVYGVSDKVLTMALSGLLLGAPIGFDLWLEAGAGMIAVDTLVHNFLHRTGSLRRLGSEHAYGAACYRTGGCAEIIRRIASRIDARAFNPEFPATFPRFVQHAIWRFCAQSGLDVCNGIRVNDRKSCDNAYCRIRAYCDRISLLKSVF